MNHHAGRITIIASSTMVHQRVRCMICDRPVDHRVVFMTNDARVLHAGCIPDHVKVPTTVLLQAIRRLERMVARARNEDGAGPRGEDPATDTPPAPSTAVDPAASAVDPAATGTWSSDALDSDDPGSPPG
ncbi:MAG TPA: hypothetical protein VID07_11235 [Actinomycetes bacterium]|jgi:hypothetical protein